MGVRVAAAIYAQARVTINRVFIQAALNAGLHVQAEAAGYLPPSSANGFAIYDLKVFQCGCGIVTRGGDCNASTVIHADIELFDKSDKEVGIAERSFLGNHYYSCQVGVCKGPAYLVTSEGNSGGLYGCYSEGDTGPIHIASTSFIVFGGNYASGFTKESQGWVIDGRLNVRVAQLQAGWFRIRSPPSPLAPVSKLHELPSPNGSARAWRDLL